jgi:HTH-type transcriptional regulator, global nitrogen regulator NrpRI
MVLVGNTGDTERKIIEILKVLSGSTEPLGSITIARELENRGIFLSERAVRYHLRMTDERGYTRPLGRDGRAVTETGLEELKMALAPEQVGFIHDKLELIAFLTGFDPHTGKGQIPINTTLIEKSRLKEAFGIMKEAFEANLCVSKLVGVAREGEKLGSVLIPKGKCGIATLCSVGITGVLLKAGVPTEYRFGGVLEIKDFKPRRFVAIINYAGTSIDPSEQYIMAKMTSVREAARTGHGKILAVFRAFPAPAKDLVSEKTGQLKKSGVGGVFAVGNVSEPVCHIPVNTNRIGMIILGGLNPIAAVAEAGIPVENSAESGLIPFEQLKDYKTIDLNL